jgi:hypothetical protein
MTLTVEIPDDLVQALATPDTDPTRAVLEAVALEGYRADRLSEYEVQRLLGLETRMDVHAFLKEHGVYLHYTAEDLEHDMAEADRYRALKEAHNPTELHTG